MILAAVLSIAVAVVGVHAQNNALEIQAIQQHFINSRLVTDLIPAFNPIAYLNVTWKGVSVSPGTLLNINGTSKFITEEYRLIRLL